jgi:tetratricopeptide (TPR) repeat protein
MRRLFLLLIVVALAAGSGWAALRPGPDGARRALSDAAARLDAGDTQGALRSAELAFRTAHTSDEAAAMAALARATADDLPTALGRIEAAARRDPANAEAALEAGLLARFLARGAPDGSPLRERARDWLREAVRRADAAADWAPDAFDPRAVAVAARIAGGDTFGALARLESLAPGTPAEVEQTAILRAAARAARGHFDAALAALHDVPDPASSPRVAAAIARVTSWRDAAAVPDRVIGLQAWAERDLVTTADALSRWTDDHPDDPLALAVLATALARRGDDGAVVRKHEALSVARPDGPAAPYFRACHLLAAGRADDAVTAFTLAARSAPDSCAVLRGIVLGHLARGVPSDAVGACRERFARGDPSGTSELLLGASLEAAGDVAGAEAALREAVRRDPGEAEAADRLADLLVRTGRAAAALEVAQTGLAASPDSTVLRLRVGLAQAATGDRAAAETTLRALVRDDPACPAAHVHLGRVLAMRGAADEAEAAFHDALRRDADALEARLGLLTIAHAQGHVGAFADELRSECASRPQAAVPAFVLGAAADLAGDLDRAESQYRRALALEPRFGLAANNLAWLLAVHRGRAREALPLAEDAVRLLPRSPQALDTRGWVRHLCRDLGAAEPDLAAARAGLPQDPDIAVRHARTLLALGRPDEASEALRAALAAAPAIRQDPAFRAAATLAHVRFE